MSWIDQESGSQVLLLVAVRSASCYTKVVQCVHDQIEAFEPVHSEFLLLDVLVARHDIDMRVECQGRSLCNLR